MCYDNIYVIFAIALLVFLMKVSEFRRRIESIGCFVKRHGGRHDIYYSPLTGEIFPVSRHGSEEIPKGTLLSMSKKAGLK